MKAQTQKDKVLALLQQGETRDTKLWGACPRYLNSISELRKEGYRIVLIYRLDGNYYQLIGENEDGPTANITTQFQSTHAYETGEPAAASL